MYWVRYKHLIDWNCLFHQGLKLVSLFAHMPMTSLEDGLSKLLMIWYSAYSKSTSQKNQRQYSTCWLSFMGITGSLAKYPGSTRLLYNCKKLGSDLISQSQSASSMVTLIHWDRFAYLATSVSAHHTTSKRSNILKFCEMHLFMIKRNFPERKSILDQGGFRCNTWSCLLLYSCCLGNTT